MRKLLNGISPSGLVLATLVLLASSGFSRQKSKAPQFKYVGGTESVPEACAGNLEVASDLLIFKCESRSISIPYLSINLMQYRPEVSRQVRTMKLKWKLKPPYGGGKENRYFTVLYDEEGATHAVILKVLPKAMRPYLAEIDLKTGKRVEVKGLEEYD